MVLKNRGCYSIPLFYHLRHNMLCISIIQKLWLFGLDKCNNSQFRHFDWRECFFLVFRLDKCTNP